MKSSCIPVDCGRVWRSAAQHGAAHCSEARRGALQCNVIVRLSFEGSCPHRTRPTASSIGQPRRGQVSLLHLKGGHRESGWCEAPQSEGYARQHQGATWNGSVLVAQRKDRLEEITDTRCVCMSVRRFPRPVVRMCAEPASYVHPFLTPPIPFKVILRGEHTTYCYRSGKPCRMPTRRSRC